MLDQLGSDRVKSAVRKATMGLLREKVSVMLYAPCRRCSSPTAPSCPLKQRHQPCVAQPLGQHRQTWRSPDRCSSAPSGAYLCNNAIKQSCLQSITYFCATPSFFSSQIFSTKLFVGWLLNKTFSTWVRLIIASGVLPSRCLMIMSSGT